MEGAPFDDRVRVDDETGCVEWTGPVNNGGYGYCEHGGHQWLAHRLSWTLFCGPIPRGKYVLHRCDNPPCVNPDHLFVGTAKDNYDDMINKGRHPGGFPEWAVRKRRIRKLTDDVVRAIRRAEGTQEQIAEMFGVSRNYVSEIRSRKRKFLVPDDGPVAEPIYRERKRDEAD